ncbi:glycosyltransferase family 1 protein [Xylariaceae sp. FL0255]|nr:glycosyltransferase family 1 protein [Xylariaceae sp. FL0255]
MSSQAEEEAIRRRVARTVLLQRQETHRPTLEFPDRFKDLHDDADEDVLPPTHGPFMNMNQSIFGLIAAAGSSVDFNDRFEGNSSGDDDDGPERYSERKDKGKQVTQAANTTILTRTPPNDNKKEKHRRKLSGQLLRSLPQLPRLGTRSSSKHSKLKTSHQIDTSDDESAKGKSSTPSSFRGQIPAIDPTESDDEERLAPVMSRMLEARAEMSSRPSFDIDGLARDQQGVADETGPSALAEKLREIFGFDSAEEVIEEYPCWLLQSVLLQGYLYITSKHICFYAYLPKKSQNVAKSGYLAKSGKRNPKYSRFWFRLKGDVLAYYRDASNLYFPHGQIDLRYAISVTVTDKDKDAVNFSVVTHNRTFHFRADSAPSAKEWVKSLQRVIFRSHNDGDSVKISLPIENIVDVEDSQIIEFADTCKLRVIDNDETYSIDEYFFSFFSFGQEAINVIKVLVEGASARHNKDKSLSQRTITRESSRSGSKKSKDAHQVTGDTTKGRRRTSSISQERPDSSDSYVQSMEDPSMSGILASSNEDPSGSQILKGSEVFHRPIIRRSTSGSRTSGVQKTYEGSVREGKKSISPKKSQGAATTAQMLDPSDGEQADSTLGSIAKMGSYPLQKAGLLAKFLDQTGRRMSNLLATESMGYAEKVSGMWIGGRKHYNRTPELDIEDYDDEDEEDAEGKNTTAMERFRKHFALPENETLRATYFGFLIRVLPLYGKVYISDRHFCFRSLLPGTRTKLILPLKDIETADKETGFRFGYSGLVVVIRAHEELFFEFNQAEVRDDCAVTLLKGLEETRHLREADRSETEDGAQGEANEAIAERDALKEARLREVPEHELKLPQDCSDVVKSAPPILFDDPKASLINFKPSKPMTITCLTIGSRGDVQPYIALCKGLMADGHTVRIATHTEFKDWVEGHGIAFAPVAGDPTELMRLCTENGTFTIAFMREATSKFRTWVDDLLVTAFKACQGSDLIIESPSAMAGIHIAEALSVPYFRAFTMPWTRTRAYPHAFAIPDHKLGGAYNYVTYLMFDNVFWKTTAGQVNRWRRKTLHLPNTNLEKMQPNKVPFLYNFSPAVVAPPLDYSDWIRVTGYWFLDEGRDWTPPEDLQAFIDQARRDNKKLVYVGFGSIVVPDSFVMTEEVIDAVQKADVRCILSKGWIDRLEGEHKEHIFPKEIFQIKSAPHDWLFQQIDAAAHHGGSGTTGASLRAGIPTIIRPFFGDQFFFGMRVEDLGVGICLKKWGSNSFAKALWEATNSERMIVKARVLGETIRNENGVNVAIQSIYRDLEYARSLVAAKTGKYAAGAGNLDGTELEDESEEESWTFVGGDEFDPELVVKQGKPTGGNTLHAGGSDDGEVA